MAKDLLSLFYLSFCALLIAGCHAASSNEAAVNGMDEEYPAVPILDVFRESCSRLENSDVAQEQILASGWSIVSDPSSTPVGPIVTFGVAAGGALLEEIGGEFGSIIVFEQIVENEELYLVYSDVVIEGAIVNGCRLYDVNEARRISIDTATGWIGREPDRQIESDEFLQAAWEPGILNARDSFEIFHVPEGSSIIQMTQIAGVMLKSDLVLTSD